MPSATGSGPHCGGRALTSTRRTDTSTAWARRRPAAKRQRVILARALDRRPDVLFRDEPTEAVIAAALRALKMTRIIVVHRSATVAHADLRYGFPVGRAEVRETATA